MTTQEIAKECAEKISANLCAPSDYPLPPSSVTNRCEPLVLAALEAATAELSASRDAFAADESKLRAECAKQHFTLIEKDAEIARLHALTLTESQSAQVSIAPDWNYRRAPECDTAAREANIDGLLTFIILRHSAWDRTPDDNPNKAVYLEARDNAIRELKWRAKELWNDNDLRARKSQRLVETLNAVRDVLKERAGYEDPVPQSKIRLLW